jgi:putative ABC transport system ATP-binding protein
MNVKMKSIIHLDKISKKYDEYGVVVNALDAISLTILPGEFVSIIGPSGSGKSTLLHCMGLLDKPTSGQVMIDGKDTTKITGKEIAQFRGEKLGFVFQNYNLIPRLTVLENVILPGLILQKNPKFLEEKARTLLQDAGILHRCDHKGIHLSGGEQQRVAIARSLINDPVLILADEPTGALDTNSTAEIMDILSKINEKKKTTIVFVSHDLEIAKYAKRTIVIVDGKIVGDTKGDKKQFDKIIKVLKNFNGEKKHGY